MDDEMTVNLTGSLRRTATDLTGVANGLASLSTDVEIECLAKILDYIAEDASQGAAMLRALIDRRKRAHGLYPGGATRLHQRALGLLGPGSEAS